MTSDQAKHESASASSSPRHALLRALSVLAIATGLGLIALRYPFWSGTPEPPRVKASELPLQVAEDIRHARETVLRKPSAASWGELGQRLHAHGFSGEAEICYREAARLDPSRFEWPYLAAHAIESREPETALAHIERAVAINPGYPPALLLWGQLLETTGRPGEAEERFRAALEMDPAHAASAFALGSLLLARQEYEEGRRLLERAAALRPAAKPIHAALAALYQRLGEEERAADAAAAAARLTGGVGVLDPILSAVEAKGVSSFALLRRAERAFGNGLYAEAERLYRTIAQLYPDTGEGLYGLGNSLARLGKLTEAEQVLQRLVALDPTNLEARRNLGALLAMTGRSEAALEAFRAILSSDPDNADALHSIGKVLAGQQRYGEASAFLRRAVEADPRSGAIHRDLAAVLAAEGDREGALKHIGEAERLGQPVPGGLKRGLSGEPDSD
jgi:tetratricopeptide (TPR) repeat protein